jgi:hypothetical protein
MGGVEVGQLRYEFPGSVRDLRVVLQQAGQRLSVQHLEADHPVAGAGLIPAHGGGGVDDEPHPLLPGQRDVLDRAAHGQFAGRGLPCGLLVGQAAAGITREVTLPSQGLQQVGTFPATGSGALNAIRPSASDLSRTQNSTVRGLTVSRPGCR